MTDPGGVCGLYSSSSSQCWQGSPAVRTVEAADSWPASQPVRWTSTNNLRSYNDHQLLESVRNTRDN